MSGGQVCAFIDAEKTLYRVRRLCRMFAISPTTFYAWVRRGRGPTAAELADAYAIHELHQAWGRASPHLRRATADRQRSRHRGRARNCRRVARPMRLGAIEGVHRRRRSASTAGRPDPPRSAPDLVDRDFNAAGPNQLWVADITYVPTMAGFLYLAVVLDAWSRKIVGWAMANHLRAELVLDAMEMAVGQRRPKDVIHHSDQGSQYTSVAFGKRCGEAGVRPSMGSVGDAYDNAMAESFFATLKAELVYRQSWPTRHQLEMEVFSYLEGFYNTRRRHSRLGNLSPTDYETLHMTQNEVSA